MECPTLTFEDFQAFARRVMEEPMRHEPEPFFPQMFPRWFWIVKLGLEGANEAAKMLGRSSMTGRDIETANKACELICKELDLI